MLFIVVAMSTLSSFLISIIFRSSLFPIEWKLFPALLWMSWTAVHEPNQNNNNRKMGRKRPHHGNRFFRRIFYGIFRSRQAARDLTRAHDCDRDGDRLAFNCDFRFGSTPSSSLSALFPFNRTVFPVPTGVPSLSSLSCRLWTIWPYPKSTAFPFRKNRNRGASLKSFNVHASSGRAKGMRERQQRLRTTRKKTYNENKRKWCVASVSIESEFAHKQKKRDIIFLLYLVRCQPFRASFEWRTNTHTQLQKKRAVQKKKKRTAPNNKRKEKCTKSF